MLKVLVIDEIRERALDICEALTRGGHMVAAVLPDAFALHEKVHSLQPDVILIHTDSPSRDTLENLAVLDRNLPRPVLMFAGDKNDTTMRNAMRAGVSSYVVDGLSPESLLPLLKTATYSFEAFQTVKRERDEAQRKLSERVLVDKAKGILMKSRGMSEDEAYHALRKLAMEKGRKIGDVAEQIISAADLLLG